MAPQAPCWARGARVVHSVLLPPVHGRLFGILVVDEQAQQARAQLVIHEAVCRAEAHGDFWDS